MVILFLFVAIYFNINICIEIFIKNKDNPYSVENVFNNIDVKDEKNFEKNIYKMVSIRKYQSNVDRFYKIIHEKELTQNEYVILYNVIKREKDIDKNHVYKKIKKIDFYYELCKKLDREYKVECEKSIKDEINEVYNLLEKPEVCRLGLDEIENIKKTLKHYN